MGVETAIAIGAGASLLGSGLQYGENRAARKRAEKASTLGSRVAGAPLPTQDFNVGQDSFLQYLRANPTALKPFQFDASQAFKDLMAQDQQTINDQALQLSAGAWSLGSRYGSGFAAKDAILRSRFASDIAARNAGIAQSSFNTALSTGMQDFGLRQSNLMQLLALRQQGELARREQQLQALGLGSAIPQTNAGQLVSQTGSDLSQLLLISKFLNKGS